MCSVIGIVGSGPASYRVHQPPATSISILSTISFSRPSKCKHRQFWCINSLWNVFHLLCP